MKKTKSLRIRFPMEEPVHRHMVSRCYNPKATGYHLYGGRGITVCSPWKESFFNFLKDMGTRPSRNHTLDRIDYNKGYEPSNCRWVTSNIQNNNKRNNHRLDINGEILTIQQWANKLNIKSNTVVYRIRRGWTIDQALGLVKRQKKPSTSRLAPLEKEIMTMYHNGTSISEIARKIDYGNSNLYKFIMKTKRDLKEMKNDTKHRKSKKTSRV